MKNEKCVKYIPAKSSFIVHDTFIKSDEKKILYIRTRKCD